MLNVYEAVSGAPSRLALWSQLLHGVRTMVEVGVYRGEFAAEILKIPSIEKYYLLDPWRHLDQWNKPANKSDEIFEQFLKETEVRTSFAGDKRTFLRGTTSEVIDQISDSSLDFAYVDADHTLRGITIDLHLVYPKVKAGGLIGGDDFVRSAWQHGARFEPTLVFPYAVYFAEATRNPIYGLPFNQFLIVKEESGFAFHDFTGKYGETRLLNQFRPRGFFSHQAKKFARLLRRGA